MSDDQDLNQDLSGSPQPAPIQLVPWVTYAQVAFLILIFFVEQKIVVSVPLGWFQPSYRTLSALGGLSYYSVFEMGQWYRIFTGPLLHASFTHIIGNMLALYFIGIYLEIQIGKSWFFILCFLGALGGSAMALLINNHNLLVVGYSGAISALLMAACIFSFRLPAGKDRRMSQGRLLLFLIPLLLPMLGLVTAQHVDLSAHLGGLLVGGVFGLILTRRWPHTQSIPPSLRHEKPIIGIGLMVLFAAIIMDINGFNEKILSLANKAESSAPRTSDPVSGGVVRPLVRYTGVVTLSGFTVHLPPGDWDLLELGKNNDNSELDNKAYFFVHIKDNHLDGAISLSARRSKSLPGEGFQYYKNCLMSNSANRNFVNASDGLTEYGHQACWLIADEFMPELQKELLSIASVDSVIHRGILELRERNVDFSQDYMSVHFYRAEKWGDLTEIIMNNPDAEQITSSNVSSREDSDWYPLNIWKHREKMAYLERLKDWSGKNWTVFKQDFMSGDPQNHGGSVLPVAQSAVQTPAQILAVPKPMTQQPAGAVLVAFNRGARSGTKQMIDSSTWVNPDCTSNGYPSIVVTVPPLHGDISTEHGEVFPVFPPGNPRSVCNTKKVNATKLFYTSTPNYTGPDSLETTIIHDNGLVQKRKITIEVQ